MNKEDIIKEIRKEYSEMFKDKFKKCLTTRNHRIGNLSTIDNNNNIFANSKVDFNPNNITVNTTNFSTNNDIVNKKRLNTLKPSLTKLKK